jgi:nucleoside-triphosphatase THEP1
MSNPFHPTFGTQPPVLIGRTAILRDVQDGLSEGPGSPLRALTITGPRGIGKTVILGAAHDVALQAGWVSVGVTAGDHLLTDILDLARRQTAHLTDRPWRVTGVQAGGFGLTIQTDSPQGSALTPGWRVQMEAVLDVLAEHDTGLMITIDEVGPGSAGLEQATKAFQHFIQDGRDVAIIFAGLPGQIADMASQAGMTFIWRAERRHLGPVPLAEVRQALETTITASGRRIATEDLRRLADATWGYPFFIQLVGYHVWRQSDSPMITADDITAGVAEARRRLGTTVHEYTVRGLSAADRAFLSAMALDDGPSKVHDLSQRLDRPASHVSVYRQRLIDAGVIQASDRGLVDFAVPYLREYIRDQMADSGTGE